MSREFHLITRERPSADGFLAALSDAARGTAKPEMDGDFDNPNGYVNVSGPRLWIEAEAPGHVDAADLDDAYPSGTVLPEVGSEQCLWLTVANIPAGAPAHSADVVWRALEDLAARCQGNVVEP